jgi:hypothetical protein
MRSHLTANVPHPTTMISDPKFYLGRNIMWIGIRCAMLNWIRIFFWASSSVSRSLSWGLYYQSSASLLVFPIPSSQLLVTDIVTLIWALFNLYPEPSAAMAICGIYVHIYIYTHTHTHTYIYTYEHTHTHTHTHIYVGKVDGCWKRPL